MQRFVGTFRLLENYRQAHPSDARFGGKWEDEHRLISVGKPWALGEGLTTNDERGSAMRPFIDKVMPDAWNAAQIHAR